MDRLQEEEVHLNSPVGGEEPRRGDFGETFLALRDITAVSWLTTGLADWHRALSTWTLGLMAGAEVTGALRWYGGAAASRGGVTFGQDGILGAGGHLKGRARHSSTLQLLCGLLALAAVDVGEVVVAALRLTHAALRGQVTPREHAGWVGWPHILLSVPVPMLMPATL